jgi:hypothetical protein
MSIDPTGTSGIAVGVAGVAIVGAAVAIAASRPKPKQTDPFSAANDPVFGGGNCPADCAAWRAVLNRMYHALDQLRNSVGASSIMVFAYEAWFAMEVRRYEKECGRYDPPPSMHDIYTK